MADDARREPDLVEPEGVNAGPPVDSGADPAEVPDGDRVSRRPRAGGAPGAAPLPGPDPDRDPEGQGAGELLSSPGSHHGMTSDGPGQEVAAGEG